MKSVGAIKINATNSSGSTDGDLSMVAENEIKLTSLVIPHIPLMVGQCFNSTCYWWW